MMMPKAASTIHRRDDDEDERSEYDSSMIMKTAAVGSGFRAERGQWYMILL